MNELKQKYPQEVDQILAKYPSDMKRAAAMPLLYLAQREHGFITKSQLGDIAELCDMSPTDVAALVGFYTLYHEHPGGTYRIQVCNDLPCALRGADEFLEKLCENLGVQLGETTPDGLVTVEAVMCLAGCNHAPMFQVQTADEITYQEDQTVESALAMIDSWKKETPEKGPVSAESSVSEIAENGITRLDRLDRVRIMQEGGQ